MLAWGGARRKTLCGGFLCINLLFEYLRVVFPPKRRKTKLLCQDLTRIWCVCTIIFQKKFCYAFSTIVPDMQMPVLLICIHNIHQTAVLVSAKEAC